MQLKTILLFLISNLVSCANLTPLTEEHSAITYKQFKSQQKFVTLDSGHKLAYTDEGAGQAILLVHGLPTSSWMYRHISTKLSKMGYRVIAPDMLGYGNSDKPKGFDIYSSEMQAKRLLELMHKLNIDNWVQLFHDAGGLWSWNLLKIAPEKVSSLVVLNTIIYQQGFHPAVRFTKGAVGKNFADLFCAKISSILTVKATLTNGLSTKGITHKEAQGYYKPLAGANCDAIYYFMAHTKHPNFNFSTTIKSLTQPTLVIWGENDDVLSFQQQVPKLQSELNIADENIHLLPGKKHFIAEEAPDTIVRLLDSFLKQLTIDN